MTRAFLSRRHLLAGAGATALAAGAAADAQAVTEELPQYGLAGFLAGETQAFRDAAAAVDQAVLTLRLAEDEARAALARYDVIAPTLPREIDATRLPPWRRHDHSYTDVTLPDGKAVTIEINGETVPVCYFPSRTLKTDLLDHGPRTFVGKNARRMLPIAEAYEAQVIAAEQASGAAAALDDRDEAGERLDKAVGALVALPAATPAGVLAKLLAIAHEKEVDAKYRPSTLAMVGMRWLPAILNDAALLAAAQA